MLKFLRGLGVISILGLLAIQFQNCSSYNENTLFDSKEPVVTNCEGDACADPTTVNLTVTIPSSGLMRGPDEDILQVSGKCNDALAEENVISAVIKNRVGDIQTLVRDDQGDITEALDIKCENGEFFALIPASPEYINMDYGDIFYLYMNITTYDATGKKLQEKIGTGTKVVITAN